MIYNYCGIVFRTEITFPFFYKDSINTPDFEIINSDSIDCFDDSYPAFFKRTDEYILNFGEQGYYEISEKCLVCHFKDIAYMYATICNIPFAVVAILRGMLPCHSSSLILNDQNAVLFLGEKGAGKTTMACMVDNYNLGCIFGDDMVTVSKMKNSLHVYRGSKLMKVTPETAALVDINRISDEVYPGLNKNYYAPINNSLTHNTAKLDKVFLLERGSEINYRKVPSFLCKPIFTRHIVGISILGQLFAHSINDMLNCLSFSEIYKLSVPNNLTDLKLGMQELINIIK